MIQTTLDLTPPYNGLPGYKEDGASRDMAIKVADKAKIDAERVYRVLLQAPATGSEIEAATGISLFNVRPRLTDLKIAGLIRKSGERRMNAKGNSETVWCAI